MNDFPLMMTREVEVAREDVPGISASGAEVRITVRPALAVTRISLRRVGVGGPRSARAVVAVWQPIVRPPGVVINTDVVERTTVVVAAPLDVEAVVAGVEITRVEVHTAVLLGEQYRRRMA